jgi:tetratricopeptide (TPR) repeat protein
VLASVLKNTHWGLWLPEKFEQRLTLVDEALRVASSTNDASAKFDAHLFRFFVKLELADMPAAQDEFSACMRWASELKQPYTSWMSASADVCRALMLGRLDDAEQMVEEAFHLGEKVQGAHAPLLRGIQLAHLHWLRGRFAELATLYEELDREYPGLQRTIECASALSLCEQGRTDQASEQFERLAGDGFEQLPHDAARIQNVTFLAQVCAILRDAPRAEQLYDVLRPFEGRVIVFAPVLVWGPASHFLGLLAATAGREDLAKRHFEDALATSTRMGTKQWLARTQLAYAQLLVGAKGEPDRSRAIQLLQQSVRIGDKLRMRLTSEQARTGLRCMEEKLAPPALVQGVPDREGNGTSHSRVVARQDETGADSTNVFRYDGGYWTIAYEGKCIRLPDRKGFKLLAILLAHPEEEFHVLRLLQLIEGIDPEMIGKGRIRGKELDAMNIEGGLDPLLDDRAKREYADAIASLQEQIEEADRFNEAAKVSGLRERLRWFVQERNRAVGPSGKDRPVDDPAERARQKVRKNFKSALIAIRSAHASLGHYLETHVRTGRFCSYRPDPRSPDRWTIE